MSKVILIWERKHEVSDLYIKNVEDYFAVKFPKVYCELVGAYDLYGLKVLNPKGGKDLLPVIPISDSKREDITFYHFKEYLNAESIKHSDIVIYHSQNKDILPVPEKMIPFASTSGKDKYLFDYRENEKEPAILFWDTDEINEDAFEMDPEEYMEEYDEDIEVGKNDGFYKIADSFEEFLNMIEADDK